MPQLAALQAAVGLQGGTSASSRHAPGSKEQLYEGLCQLCSALGGVQVTPDMVATPATAAATIAQLKRHVGM